MDSHLILSFCQDRNIKHVSIDFWGTICDSNQVFKQKRNSLLAKLSGKEISYIKDAFDSVAYRHNKQMMSMAPVKDSSMSLLKHVLGKIGITDENSDIYHNCLSLFLEYLPAVRTGVLETLYELQSNGFSLSILSNTAFIPGTLIEASLQKLKISEKISFYVFSDRVGFGKPTPVVFQEVLTNAKILTKTNDITREEILHIGDSQEADINGALDFGFHALLI